MAMFLPVETVRYPRGFPAALRPSVEGTEADRAPGADPIARQIWKRAEAVLERSPELGRAFRPGDSLQERAEIWRAMAPFLPGGEHADLGLEPREDASALEYVVSLRSAAALLSLDEMIGIPDPEEIDGEYPTLLALPAVLEAARRQATWAELGVSEADLEDPEIEARAETLRQRLSYPRRERGESWTAFLRRVFGRLDPHASDTAEVVLRVRTHLARLQRARLIASVRQPEGTPPAPDAN